VQEGAGRCRRVQEGAGAYIVVEEVVGRCRRVHEGIAACRIVKRVQEGSGGCGSVQECA
jgi:hypothetical protein